LRLGAMTSWPLKPLLSLARCCRPDWAIELAVAQYAIHLEIYAADTTRELWGGQARKRRKEKEEPAIEAIFRRTFTHVNPRIPGSGPGAGPGAGTPIAAHFGRLTGSEFPLAFEYQAGASRNMVFCRAGRACPDLRCSKPMRRPKAGQRLQGCLMWHPSGSNPD